VTEEHVTFGSKIHHGLLASSAIVSQSSVTNVDKPLFRIMVAYRAGLAALLGYHLLGLSVGFVAPRALPHPCSSAVQRPSSRLHMSVPNPLDTLTSGLASICRMPSGTSVDRAVVGRDESLDTRPVLKRLYDVENSRSCRLVRERITELDLVVEAVVPAARNSLVFDEAGDRYALPSGAVIPRLVVSNRGEEVVLSGDQAILEYLNQAFADGEPSDPQEDGSDIQRKVVDSLREIGSYVAGPLRAGRGDQVCGAAKRSRPNLPLILYSYEGNQFCRLVREVLTELDLVYELRSAGKGSPRREELASKSGGSTQCPYLIDPNTGTSMAESADIIRYLYRTYALYTPPNEILHWVSDVVLPLAKPLFTVLAPIQAGSRKEDLSGYERELREAIAEIESTTGRHNVVIYSYDWSPFSTECKAVLNSLNIDYHDVSLGPEWIPGLIKEGGALTRAGLLEMTGQSSLPHVFVRGKSVGGLFSGTPGLLNSLEDGTFERLLQRTNKNVVAAGIVGKTLRVEDTQSDAFA
jgi:glutathione S-transferase